MAKPSSLLERNLLNVFNQRDVKKRKAALQELWATNGILWSAEGTFLGRNDIDRAAADLIRRYPEFEFRLLGPIDEIPKVARVNWSFGAYGSPPAITGMDVVLMLDGRIAAIYRFLDGAGL